MISSRWLFWHRKDLRMSDNIGLNFALSKSKAVSGIYIFDTCIFHPRGNIPAICSAQMWFIIKSLKELKGKWEDIGSRLLILKGNPLELIPLIAKSTKTDGVIWNNDIEPETKQKDYELKNKLEKDNIKVINFWDQLLIEPDEIKNLEGNPYKIFTPFQKKWKKKADSLSSLKLKTNIYFNYKNSFFDITKGTEKYLKNHLANNGEDRIINLDKLYIENKFLGEEKCPCKPGEKNSNKQLIDFCRSELIGNYSINRDMPGEIRTSYLSAALRFGTISPRQAWQEAETSLINSNNYFHKNSIQIWQKELIWREFYQHSLFHFPELLKGPFKKKWIYFPWENNKDYLRSWYSAETGVPIIDASIRQLTQTGWMHNRCRMIVASFLVKDLICDWRLGERFFLENLVDGDIAANNGGWQWSASSGMDSKPLRIFNPFRQAAKFDPNGKFIRKWLPELTHVSTSDLISGNIGSLERKGYPEPIINHKNQQAKFKLLYQTIKE